MRVQLGVGNAVTTAFDASAKTLAFSGAYNFDINPENLTVYNTTRSAYMWGGGTTATLAITATGPVFTTVAGLLVQTITLSALPASSANGDSLVIMVNVDDSIGEYNAIVTT